MWFCLSCTPVSLHLPGLKWPQNSSLPGSPGEGPGCSGKHLRVFPLDQNQSLPFKQPVPDKLVSRVALLEPLVFSKHTKTMIFTSKQFTDSQSKTKKKNKLSSAGVHVLN